MEERRAMRDAERDAASEPRLEEARQEALGTYTTEPEHSREKRKGTKKQIANSLYRGRGIEL